MMIKKILQFIREVGDDTRHEQRKLDLYAPSYRQDTQSPVLTLEQEIYKRFKKFIEENFGDFDYNIISEISSSKLTEEEFSIATKHQYLFVIQPLGEKRPYAMKTPEFAVSIGVIKNGKPFLGAIYLPVYKEILYFDGEDVHWKQAVGFPEESDQIITTKKCCDLAVIFSNPRFVKINEAYNPKYEAMLNFYSTAVHLFYVITNRTKAYYFGSYLWDIAGAWPMLKHLGYEIISYSDRENLDEFNIKTFNEKFKVRDLHIVCDPKDYDKFKLIAYSRIRKS